MNTLAHEIEPSHRSLDFTKSRATPSLVNAHPALNLQRTMGNRAVQRLLARAPVAKPSPASSPARERKCGTCESGSGKCPACSPEEGASRKLRALITDEQLQADSGERLRALPDTRKRDVKKEPEKPKEAKKEEFKCPTQTVTMSSAKCGSKYGAIGKYCYAGIKDWWFKEKVVLGSPANCVSGGGGINQTSAPFQKSGNCVEDDISNLNGPPKNIGSCTDVTNQIVFTGPTKAEVEKCQYKNKQVIKVTSAKDKKSGKVITSSSGVSTECSWS